MKTTPSGLQYEDVVIGEGAAAEAGRRELVHYTGWLYIEGKKGSKFDSRKDRNQPFDFALGAGAGNRRPLAGYKVVFVPCDGGRPSGPPLDVLTGFVSEQGDAYGRPVGVALDRTGALLVADDVGNAVWRVSRRP